MHSTEGPLEPLAMVLLRMDPEIERVLEQPVTIPWSDGEGNYHYTPDLLIFFKPGLEFGFGAKPWLVEIKTRSDLKKDRQNWRRKFREATRYARARGWIFKVITDRELKSPASQVATFLRHAVDLPRNPEISEGIMEALRTGGRTTPTRLLEAVFPDPSDRSRALRYVWSSLASNLIDGDTTRPLDAAKTEIWLPPQGTMPTSLNFIRRLMTGKRKKRLKRQTQNRP
ncbi:MAG: hypothetical protein QOH88_1755 [Verrucomicrobiota bacterium]|jgi:hypothetical protein